MARTIRLTDEVLRDQLIVNEKVFKMTSAEFYELFASGMLKDNGHDPAYMHWAWLYEIAVKAGVATKPAARI